MAAHSNMHAWRIPGTEEPGVGYSPWGRQELDTTEQLTLGFTVSALTADVKALARKRRSPVQRERQGLSWCLGHMAPVCAYLLSCLGHAEGGH